MLLAEKFQWTICPLAYLNSERIYISATGREYSEALDTALLEFKASDE